MPLTIERDKELLGLSEEDELELRLRANDNFDSLSGREKEILGIGSSPLSKVLTALTKKLEAPIDPAAVMSPADLNNAINANQGGTLSDIRERIERRHGPVLGRPEEGGMLEGLGFTDVVAETLGTTDFGDLTEQNLLQQIQKARAEHFLKTGGEELSPIDALKSLKGNLTSPFQGLTIEGDQ